MTHFYFVTFPYKLITFNQGVPLPVFYNNLKNYNTVTKLHLSSFQDHCSLLGIFLYQGLSWNSSLGSPELNYLPTSHCGVLSVKPLIYSSTLLVLSNWQGVTSWKSFQHGTSGVVFFHTVDHACNLYNPPVHPV